MGARDVYDLSYFILKESHLFVNPFIAEADPVHQMHKRTFLGLLGLLCINLVLFRFFDKGSYNFEHQVFLILNAVCSALDDTDLVIQAFHESK